MTTLPHQDRIPAKVRRTVEDGVVTIMAARLDGSGPLLRTTFREAHPVLVDLALREPTVAGVMRALREAHELTQAEAAAAVDCDRQTLGLIECGRNRRNAWIPAFCRLWGVSYADVIHGPRLRDPDPSLPLPERLAAVMRRNDLNVAEIVAIAGVTRPQVLRLLDGDGIRPAAEARIRAFLDSIQSGTRNDDRDDDGPRDRV